VPSLYIFKQRPYLQAEEDDSFSAWLEIALKETASPVAISPKKRIFFIL
jgi:hypothetical protein